MKRYLNTATLKQTQTYLDATTVIDTDPRVANWFTPCPEGYKGEWVGDTYTFTLIPLPTQAELDAQALATALATWKTSRQLAVESIEVTYDLIIYQGDEVSQGRMSRSIVALPDDVMTVQWIAKDNSVQLLNKVQLKAILLDAGAKQSAAWNEGRP